MATVMLILSTSLTQGLSSVEKGENHTEKLLLKLREHHLIFYVVKRKNKNKNFCHRDCKKGALGE